MGEFTKALNTLGQSETPPEDTFDRILRRFDQRRRRRRAGGLAVGLAAAVALVVVGAIFGLGGEPSPAPGASPSLQAGQGVYRDPTGWSLSVPRGWHVVPFASSRDGVVGEGAQFSNMKLPRPSVVGWAPLQADGRSFPSTGIALVVGKQIGGNVQRSPVSDLPIGDLRVWAQGSALAGSPTLESIWFRGGGHLFVATVKTGPSVSRTDRRALERMLETLRYLDPGEPLFRVGILSATIDVQDETDPHMSPCSTDPALTPDEAFEEAASGWTLAPARVTVTCVDWRGGPKWIVSAEKGNVCPPIFSKQSEVGLCAGDVSNIYEDGTTGRELGSYAGGCPVTRAEAASMPWKTVPELLEAGMTDSKCPT